MPAGWWRLICAESISGNSITPIGTEKRKRYYQNRCHNSIEYWYHMKFQYKGPQGTLRRGKCPFGVLQQLSKGIAAIVHERNAMGNSMSVESIDGNYGR